MADIIPSHSIVADSLASPSSPSSSRHHELGDKDTSTPSQPQAKRVSRTYGKPRVIPDIERVGDDDVVSRARILKTAPPDAEAQVIPESDDATDNVSEFTGFAWRAQLKAIDDALNYPIESGTTSLPESIPPAFIDASTSTQQDVSESVETKTSEDLGIPQGLFDKTLSSLLPSGPQPSPISSLFGEPSLLVDDEPYTFSSKHHTIAQTRVIDSPLASDSDNTSPHHPYPITSPRRQPSITPPTSPFGDLALQDTIPNAEQFSGGASTLRKKSRNIKASSRSEVMNRRMKASTRKEVVEMHKESARLLADQHVSIGQPQTRVKPKHTITNLFQKLNGISVPAQPDSDPIATFSSPGRVFQSDSSTGNASPLMSAVPETSRSNLTSGTMTIMSQPLHYTVLQETENDKGEDDMPDASSLLHTNERRRSEQAREEKEHKKRNLEELRKQKQKFQNISKAGPSCNGSDSEDELEVVDMMLSSSSEHKIAAVHSTIQRPFHGRIDEADYSAISPRNLEPISRKNLELAARPKFLAQQTSSRNRGQQSTFSQKTLNNALLQRADSQNGAIEEKKKEEWMKAGGVFKERAPEAEKTSIADWLWKGSTRGSTRNVEDGDDDDDDHDDDDDPEYHPGNLDNRELERKTSDAGHNDNVQDDECISDQRMVISEEDTDKENHRPVSRRSKAWAIVASDDEDEMTDRKRSLSPVVLVPDSSFLENSDDIPGGDKENSAELAFSVSENKENEGVPRHHERGRIVRPNVHDDSFAFLSPSFGSQSGNNLETSREPLSRLDDEEELAFMPHAMVHGQEASTDRVLQVLHEEDREATLASVGTLRKALHRKLSSTPSEVEDVELPTLTPPTGFSQLFASQDIVEGPIPASGVDDGRFSQFFEQNRETPLKGKRDYFAFQQRPTEQESKDEDFEFTQPNALLPSVKISESQRREIDEMFGKDQEFKLDEAKKSKQPSRPASNAMDPLNFGSFTPSQPVPLSPQSIRRPLETLSLHSKGRETPLDESPQAGPIRRSRLLRERPQRRSSSLSPSSAPRNAFDVLRDAGASNKQRQRVAKHSIVNSEFVEAEAQESDEEFKSGFGGLKGDDEEEGADEDQDTILEGLVDDSVMDDRDQAADLVLEKHLEHQAADDAELHRIHQAAVDGKLRGKRRDRGIAFDDSESDEEFNDPRKPSWKKRKIEGDTLDVYGQNPETRPFYETYQADLAEAESDDLRYLKDVSTQENEIQYSEEESTEVIDPADIRQKIIETSTQGFRFSSSVLDPGNANWVDFEDQDIEDMDGVQVRDGPLHPRKGPETRRSTLDHVDFRSTLQGKRPDGSEKQRLNAWARQESQTHASASGRGGFSRNDSKGSNPPRKLGKPGLVRSSTSEEGKPIAKSSSLISHVEKRRGFDH